MGESPYFFILSPYRHQAVPDGGCFGRSKQALAGSNPAGGIPSVKWRSSHKC